MIDRSPIYIIGAGLFGAVVRDLLLREGIPCYTIDAAREHAGSPAAGCLTKPSWLQQLKGWQDGVELLDELYGKRELILRTGPIASTILHFPPAKILQPAHIEGEVVHLDPDEGQITLGNGNTYSGRILVAAGVWCKELLLDRMKGVDLVSLVGASIRFPGQLVPDEARLKVWAPFKQSVAFNITPAQIWFGDGAAIKANNWKEAHIHRALDHAQDLGITSFLDTKDNVDIRTGQRPYVKGQKGYFNKVGQRCWVSTGGAKNGVVLAAMQALQFYQELCA